MQAPAAKVDVQPAFLSQNNEEDLQNSGPEEIPSLSMDNLVEVVVSETGIDAEQLVTATRARKVLNYQEFGHFPGSK